MNARRILDFIALLLGMAAAVALLAVNPLVHLGQRPASGGDGEPIVYRWLAADEPPLHVRVPRLLGIGGRATHDAALRDVDAGLMILAAGRATPAVVAVRVSLPASGNAPWRARLATVDAWHIAGLDGISLFASGYSNYWPVAGDLMLGGEDGLATAYALAMDAPPGADAPHLSGDWAGQPLRGGEIREVVIPGSPGQPAERELHLHLPAVVRR